MFGVASRFVEWRNSKSLTDRAEYFFLGMWVLLSVYVVGFGISLPSGDNTAVQATLIFVGGMVFLTSLMVAGLVVCLIGAVEKEGAADD